MYCNIHFLPYPRQPKLNIVRRHFSGKFTFTELLIGLPDVKVLDGGVVFEALEDVGAAVQAEVVAAQVQPLDESVELQ